MAAVKKSLVSPTKKLLINCSYSQLQDMSDELQDSATIPSALTSFVFYSCSLVLQFLTQLGFRIAEFRTEQRLDAVGSSKTDP